VVAEAEWLKTVRPMQVFGAPRWHPAVDLGTLQLREASRHRPEGRRGGDGGGNQERKYREDAAGQLPLDMAEAAERFTAVRLFRPWGRAGSPRWHPAARATL